MESVLEVVGTHALPYRTSFPERTVYNAKRFIGRTFEHAKSHSEEAPRRAALFQLLEPS